MCRHELLDPRPGVFLFYLHRERRWKFLLRLHHEMAVDILQGLVTTAKNLGPHSCPG